VNSGAILGPLILALTDFGLDMSVVVAWVCSQRRNSSRCCLCIFSRPADAGDILTQLTLRGGLIAKKDATSLRISNENIDPKSIKNKMEAIERSLYLNNQKWL
jgi:hypothetical protein